MIPQALAPLAAWPQFVVWRLEWNAEREKWDKIPYSPIHGGGASSTNPGHWGTLEQAEAMRVAGNFAGLGFVFSERDPFFFLDIDGALVNGQWSMVAQELCARLAGAAVEVSQSGTGLHIIGSGAHALAALNHRNKNIPLHLELYTKERFVALTGLQASGSAAADLSAVLPGVAEQFFKRDAGQTADEWTTEPDPEWVGPEDDDELIQRALRSGQQSAANAFGGAAGNPTFADLWEARADVLGAKWPANHNGHAFDHSSADQSLANMLAFWTGRNCERIERLMRKSALVRPKWEPETHATYLQNTILKAIGLVRTVYKQGGTDKPSAPPPPPPTQEDLDEAGVTARGGAPLMLYHHQLEHFEGCVYITALNKILTPRGERLDQARFDVIYGGHDFVISLDGKKTTNSAWAAFTENQAFKPTIADRICFRPEEGSGGLIHSAGLVLANSYVDIQTEETEGDPAPFLDLMARQLPDERDREILLTYMASVKQNPGMKAQWWPVLQGLKGNGKTVYLTIMAYAVGEQYSHLPNTDKMIRSGMNFNGWIDGKLFLGLEEVYAKDRREFFEGFKTTVTNRRLPIEGKGIEETTGDNRANGIITTNHRDGVPIERDERRYAPFFMRQQVAGDLQRDGLTPGYFSDFHDWLFGREAYAAHGTNYGLRVINRLLATYTLKAELDPNRLAIWAPLTSSTAEAIHSSRGRAEQEILEAIEQDQPGFAGGWVSSFALDKLLDRIRVGIPRNKRRELMQSIGYDLHPNLGTDGRVMSVTQPDNGKPKLYIRSGHLAANLSSPAAIAKAYSDAQERALKGVVSEAEGVFKNST